MTTTSNETFTKSYDALLTLITEWNVAAEAARKAGHDHDAEALEELAAATFPIFESVAAKLEGCGGCGGCGSEKSDK